MDSYRPLKLHEIIEELEHIDDEINVPDNIVIHPENANDENTVEDSGEDDLPLSLFIERSKIVQIPSKSNWVRKNLK
ncbi:hypothetical protein QE152_g1766 [Popillia japonica]|uniref:Uncharacterized protein n=1 Tax=Popillia japonica TaxID=7064 RepID=A0AAW1N3L4_POPJA